MMKLNPILLAILVMHPLASPIQAVAAPADSPLFLANRITPNIFFMVDDSGSMDWTILTKKHWEGRAYDPDFGPDNDSGDDTNSSFRDDGLFYSHSAPRSNTSTSTGSWETFYYVNKSSDDKYTSDCNRAVDQCGGTAPDFDPTNNDWRVRAAGFNVTYYDPTTVYLPWPGFPNASFTGVHDNPKSGETGYATTRSLVNYVYEVATDDRGFTGTRPKRGTDHNENSTPNGLIDLWDSHTTFKFTATGVEMTTTTYTPTSTDIGASTTSVTTLSGTTCHTQLGGGDVACRTVDEAKQNFANWYEFNRRRSLLTKGAIGTVMTSSANYRYGLSLINDYSTLFREMPADGVTDYATHNTALLNAFYSHDWQPRGTPLRTGLEVAGKYYRGTLSGHPTPITHSCQQNFTVLFTDGYWTEGSSYDPTVGNSDGDANSNTLADVARYYYVTDLSTLPNNVQPSPNGFDTATHQHMVTYGVAFGVQGNLVDTDADKWPNPALTEASNWGNPYNGDPEKIDDLWHAGYNSRGGFISAQRPADVPTAISDALADIGNRSGAASSAATNSTSLDTGSRIFQAKFSGEDWSGQLLSYTISTSAVIADTPEWYAERMINTQVGDSTTDAERGSTSDSRVIITKGSTDGVAFAYANLTGPTTTAGTQQNLLDKNGSGTTDGRGADRVNYLRGHSQHEGTTTGAFRERLATVLGDIVNSNPWYVGEPAAGYADVDHPGYSSFRSTYLNRKPVAYVGANDGMLHGFDASVVWTDNDTTVDSDGDGNLTNDHDVAVPTSTSGKEVLGYVPSKVYPNLSRLTDQNYNSNHRYFVDGSPMVADACVANCTAATATWKTVLVGSLNAGGKGFFALNVTNPAGAASSTAAPTFSEANAADILLWEFTDSDDSDLGLTYNYPASQPLTQQAKQIIKMENGKWAVVLGNGYYSTNGKAVLYILFLDGGEDGVWSTGDFVKIVADAGTGNGLSTPTPFDSDGNGLADTIYAGDLKGNMWKFNVSSTSAASWGLAFSGSPLYVAQDVASPSTNRQPIIAPPEVSVNPNGGQMVLFGTGKYLEAGDNGSTLTQSFYGVWDNNSVVAGRGSLNQKLVSTTTLNGQTYRSITSGTTAASPKGWYVDFTGGERVTGIPKLANGLIFYNTFTPTATSCGVDPAGWLMVQDYMTGDIPGFPVFDTNGDGEVSALDTAVGGLNVGAALGGTTLIRGSAGSTAGAGVSSLTDGSTVATEIEFGAGSRGRITWREIIQ